MLMTREVFIRRSCLGRSPMPVHPCTGVTELCSLWCNHHLWQRIAYNI